MPKIDRTALSERVGSSYPEPFQQHVRVRRVLPLSDAGGLSQFGVNLVRIPPGGWSSQRHWHTEEDEFVYVLEGEFVLVTNAGEEPMRPGDCAAFKGGVHDGHHLQNRSDRDAVFLVVGSRIATDACAYPDIDLLAGPSGYRHRDGTPY
jgi:uncharacterized cupin superfamily protein